MNLFFEKNWKSCSLKSVYQLCAEMGPFFVSGSAIEDDAQNGADTLRRIDMPDFQVFLCDFLKFFNFSEKSYFRKKHEHTTGSESQKWCVSMGRTFTNKNELFFIKNMFSRKNKTHKNEIFWAPKRGVVFGSHRKFPHRAGKRTLAPLFRDRFRAPKTLQKTCSKKYFFWKKCF